MDQVFTALDRRQAMLLLTTVAFGGQESLPGFHHLRTEEGALLRHRAEQLLQIPREKRIPLLIHELKRRMGVQRSQLLSADPQALAALLASERQSIAEVVLRTLPATLADQVRALLPPIEVKLTREVRPDVINAIRWKLEARLAQLAQHLPLRFVDVLLLEPRDHYGLCDRLGARAMAAAVEGLPPEEKATFLQGVTPDQRELLEAAMDAVRARALGPEDALSMVDLHQREGDPSDAVRSAGAQRLARACIAQSPELAARLLEKHRGAFGQAFMYWVREERSRARPGDGGRTEVLAEMEAMVLEGVAERPVRAPPRKIQSSTPPPPRSLAETPEVRGVPSSRDDRAPSHDRAHPPGRDDRASAGGREERSPSLAAMPVRRPSRISAAVGEARAPVAESERSSLVSPPRLLSSERAVSVDAVPGAAPAPARGAAEAPRGAPRRTLTGEGVEPRGAGAPRSRTGESRSLPSRPLAGAPRVRPAGGLSERPSREERVGGTAERPSREERVGGTAERPSREERVGGTAERPSREERVGGPAERPSREERVGGPAERPSREERAGGLSERPSREERVGGPAERPSREERVGGLSERPSREERVGGLSERPSREERVGGLSERPSREERVGGPAERPSREERMGGPVERPSREERVGGLAERPPRDARVGGHAERPPRDARAGGPAERPQREDRAGASASRPPREERAGGVNERLSREDRPAAGAERPARQERAGGPAERPSRPEQVPEARGPGDARPGRDPRAIVARPDSERPPRAVPRRGPVGGAERPVRGERPVASRPPVPPEHARPGPPVPEGTPARAARPPGVAAPSGGTRPARDPDLRGRTPRDPSARPPRNGESTADLRARAPSVTATGARPERAPVRGAAPAPSRREPAGDRSARPAAAAAPIRKAEGTRGEGRGPRPANVPGRPSRKLE